jgi:hypothetical protein
LDFITRTDETVEKFIMRSIMALRFYCTTYSRNIVCQWSNKGLCRTELHTAPSLNKLTKNNTTWGIRHRQRDDTEIVVEYRVMYEERSIVWVVIVSVIVRKQFVRTCA